MITLGIQTAIPPISFAILENGKCIANTSLPKNHDSAENLIHHLTQFLETNTLELKSLSAIGISSGPGNYTSLRIGISMVKSIGTLLNIPVYGYSSLIGIAKAELSHNGTIAAIFPATKNDINIALFASQNGHIERLTNDTALERKHAIIQLAKIKESIVIAGDIPEAYYDENRLKHHILKESILAASTFARLAFEDLKEGHKSHVNTLVPHYSHSPIIGPQKKEKLH